MRTSGDSPTAEHDALALYLLGALDETERVAFEQHLAGCWECLSAAGDMGSVTSALGGLDAADWDALAALPPEFAEFDPTRDPGGPPDPAGRPAAAPTRSLTQQASTGTGSPTGESGKAEPVGPTSAAPAPTGDEPGGGEPPGGVEGGGGRRAARRGTGARTVGAIRPAGSRPSPGPGGGPSSGAPSGGAPSGSAPSGSGPARGRPPRAARHRRFKIWGGVAAAFMAVVLAGGIVAGIGLGDRTDQVLTASGEARGQGVSLSVAITTADNQGSTIRITATGLRQGLRYRVFAVTKDGTTHTVRDWTASTGTQEVTGELAQPVDDLAFVTVGLLDGTAIVTAPITR
ncbi:zf-HC2 domain-containing protein [Micromonospora yangpuensis]|uniref:Putative zinc-finger n=1 Tax=Micromonospora yangpuensis TaxID=683228 RepID=A0A1C6V4A9_9ACTN|nr:zf-HC2 domain-containing protein [Micromonospora yangpuensis]GGM14776.1 hypothetical protein GCM10012279_36180 [Micromonospora yangpuensis]SCL60750.1 Putative zinc-finger [Micromonospora yangpuensis]